MLNDRSCWRDKISWVVQCRIGALTGSRIPDAQPLAETVFASVIRGAAMLRGSSSDDGAQARQNPITFVHVTTDPMRTDSRAVSGSSQERRQFRLQSPCAADGRLAKRMDCVMRLFLCALPNRECPEGRVATLLPINDRQRHT